MPRLHRKDAAAVEAMRSELRRIDLGKPMQLPRVVEMLRDAVGAERALAYRVSTIGEQCMIEDVCSEGIERPKAFAEALSDLVDDASIRGRFDLAAPRREQRNLVQALLPLRTQRAELAATEAGACDELDHAIRILAPWRLDREHVLRALVCDETGILAWIGIITPRAATARQRAIFSAVLPAIRDRLALVRKLACCALANATLDVVLGALPTAVYLVSTRGNIVYANPAGTSSLEREGRALRVELVEAARNIPNARFSTTPLSVEGTTGYVLITQKPATTISTGLLGATAARFALTPRQTEVLEQLITGRSNRSIASSLGCAERTIEVHVRQIFEKTGAASRSALIASVWSSAS